MKLRNNKATQNAGFTLIEITLVIALILSLIAILVISIAAYKAGSDRAKCIMNLTSIQKAVRSESNMKEIEIGQPLLIGDISGADAPAISQYFATEPRCPVTIGVYSFATTVPPIGTMYTVCSLGSAAGTDENGDPTEAAPERHFPRDTAGW